MVYFIKFILAFCSIAYELILAQSLAAFLDNTVLRYSITIGLYLFAMGFGSLLVKRCSKKGPFISLLRIEILLTVVGGFCLIWLHLMDMLSLPKMVFVLMAHALILAIGFLTGFETPLIMDMISGDGDGKENIVLAFDYAGALTGTMVFAFVFFPVMGLMPAAFTTGLLNALAGLLILIRRNVFSKGVAFDFKKNLSIHAGLVALMFIALLCAPMINDFFMGQYLQ